MARVKAQPIPQREVGARELLAELCWYFPQYSLAAARRLPARDVMLLLKTARRMEAGNYLNLTQIVAAPHTKNGAGVKNLSDRYQQEANDGR